MQTRHRRAHLWIWLVFAVLLPLGVFLGLSARQERPVETTIFAPASSPEVGSGTDEGPTRP